MKDNMLFAIIVHIQEMSASAFLSSKRMNAIELKEFPGSDTSGTDDTGVMQGERVEI